MPHPDLMSKDSPIEYDIFFPFQVSILSYLLQIIKLLFKIIYIYPQIDFVINLSPFFFIELYN